MIEKNPFAPMAPLLGEPVDPTALGTPDIAIEIIDEPQPAADGSVEITLSDEPPAKGDIKTAPFNANLADYMEEDDLIELVSELLSNVESDLHSRRDWEETYKDGIALLGLKYDARTEPWENACGVVHPMITEAVVRFQSETIMETFPAAGPVKVNVVGMATREKEDAAKRVREDMNYQTTEVMVEFRPEHEKMLWNLPATGSAFKKVYFDPALGRQTSRFVPAEDVILPYGMSDVFTCERVTHRMRKTRNEVEKLMAADFYKEIELSDPANITSDLQKAKDKETGFAAEFDDRYEIYEIHADLVMPDLDEKGDDDEEGAGGDGLAKPYVVTILKDTDEVLAIRRNWREEDPLKLKRQHFVHYIYIPGYGAYGFGLFHLIGGFAKSATMIMRQLVDAGTLSNLPGGLKTRGLRVKGDDKPIAPSEFRDVDVSSGTLKDNIMMLPYKEPSSTLFNLLQNIIEEGRRFAATADIQISDMSANTPVGTTLAVLERTLKVMSAVQARVHYSLKQELRLLAGIIRDFSPGEYEYEPSSGTKGSRAEDYKAVDILPVSDPNAATMSQRVVQYQAAMQMAAQAPTIYDQAHLHREMLEVLGIKNAAKIVPIEEDQKPADPVSENMAILNGKPTKAFIYQDHQAHITAHVSLLQDPAIAALIGQNPQAQAIQAALMAHVSEHVGYAYRQRIEQQMGVTLPPPGAELPEQFEVEMSRMVAEVAPKLVAQSQAQAAQQQAMQAMQDPLIQLQQREQALKEADLLRKQKKDAEDIRARDQKLAADVALKRDEIAQRERDSQRDFTADMAYAKSQEDRFSGSKP